MHAKVRIRPDRRFFLVLAIAALMVALGGFGPTYYFHLLERLLGGLPEGFLRSGPPLSVMVQVHAALFTAWLALLIAQSTLVRLGKPGWHGKLGMAGIALVVLMIVTGFMVVLGKPRPTVESRAFIFTPLLTLVMFPMIVAAAIRFRRDPATHKRLMLIATISLSTAAVARLMLMAGFSPNRYLAYGVTYALLLVPLAVYDLRRLGRLHAATLWGSAALLIRHPLHAGIAFTDEWQRLADSLTPG